MSIEAMKQALEALKKQHNWMVANNGTFAESSKQAIFALEKAIEFAEMVKKGTKAWADTPDDWVDELRGGAEKTVPSQQPGKWVYPEAIKCKDDPRAPHGFDRNASLSEDRYVCECEGWEPPETYSQTKLELCGVCGWDAVVPGEGCLNCARFKQWLKQSEIAESEKKDAERLQKEPEPVAWMKVWRDGSKNFYDHEPPMFGKHKTYALYTAPPKKEWAGLTGEEFDQIVPYCHNEFDLNDYKDFARAIEAKLKEKNT